jgi:phage-related protein
MKPPPIFSGTCIDIHTHTSQSERFFAELTPREEKDFLIVATILDRTVRIGRSAGGRSERIGGSGEGIWELRVTPPGRRGPHTRCLYVCDGRDILVLRCLRKAQRGIPRGEIELAERAARQLREARDEGPRRRNREAA